MQNGLLTPTLKTKRPQLKAYFKPQLEDLYQHLDWPGWASGPNNFYQHQYSNNVATFANFITSSFPKRVASFIKYSLLLDLWDISFIIYHFQRYIVSKKNTKNAIKASDNNVIDNKIEILLSLPISLQLYYIIYKVIITSCRPLIYNYCPPCPLTCQLCTNRRNLSFYSSISKL